jgi:DNA polymerase
MMAKWSFPVSSESRSANPTDKSTSPKRVGDRLVVPMFHPAAALHQPKWRPVIIEDFKKLPQFIAEVVTFSQPKDDLKPDNAEQLSLF